MNSNQVDGTSRQPPKVAALLNACSRTRTWSERAMWGCLFVMLSIIAIFSFSHPWDRVGFAAAGLAAGFCALAVLGMLNDRISAKGREADA